MDDKTETEDIISHKNTGETISQKNSGEMKYQNRVERALNNFSSGYNCAQSTLSAFAEDFGVKEEDAINYATGFGSGMATGRICGVCTGADMAIGLYTRDIPDIHERKKVAYALAKEFLERFEEVHGAVNCIDLLGYDHTDLEEEEKQPIEKRPKTVCRKFIGDAIVILSEIVEKHKERKEEQI
ncbi:C-GCAxxG-C-C family protein [Methanoplanus endosymbiosus]|uniref:C-GCAxxG-C-C family protein n=1 Tax=Methanoplanus endosymbiosus TaxID=33865 RepID=A0A9E7PLG7_9EURY|nr:C-GCAxxG-C-C family protein [Methanoplanus endosymbiosus]UUX91149.1 C-GCAxxG-C-C family protein [Methanoplanus endosymbiosus]